MDRVVIDIIGEMLIFEKGNKYILVFLDYFMKWIECFFMFNMEVKIVVKLIVEEVFVWYGVVFIVYFD